MEAAFLFHNPLWMGSIITEEESAVTQKYTVKCSAGINSISRLQSILRVTTKIINTNLPWIPKYVCIVEACFNIA